MVLGETLTDKAGAVHRNELALLPISTDISRPKRIPRLSPPAPSQPAPLATDLHGP